jgi:hypothetical protein
MSARRYSVDINRCAWAYAVSPAVAAAFSWVSLFNNNAAAYELNLLEVSTLSGALAVNGFVVAQSNLGGSSGVITPAHTGEAPPPGAVTFGSVGALPTINFSSFGSNGVSAWDRDFPFIVLRNGWSITAYGNVVNTALSFGFFYEAAFPAYLYSPNIGDQDLDPD